MRSLQETKEEILNALGYLDYAPYAIYSTYEMPPVLSTALIRLNRRELVHAKKDQVYRRILKLTDRYTKMMLHHAERAGLPKLCAGTCSLCCRTIVRVRSVAEEKFYKNVVRKLPDDVKGSVFSNAARAERLLDNLRGVLGDPNADVDELFSQYGGICPFLVNDDCAIYKDRPWSCRLIYIMGPPCEINSRRNLLYAPDVVRAILDVNNDSFTNETLIHVIRMVDKN